MKHLLPAVVGLLAAAMPGTSASPHWEAVVINMDRRPDRLERFAKTLQKKEPWLLENGRTCRVQGRDGGLMHLPSLHKKGSFLTPRQVPSVVHEATVLVHDGWMTREALDMAAEEASSWPNMTQGGMGLFLGHAAAWRHIVDKELDYGLVMEDDLLLFSKSFHEEVSKILSQDGPVPWHLLYLQRCDDPLWMKERTWWDDGEADTRIEFATSSLTSINPQQVVTCTGAYVVTKAGAQILLERGFPATFQLDYQLAYVPGLVRAAMSPPLAQCQEIFKDEHGTRQRDTDVQQYQAAYMVAHPPPFSHMGGGNLFGTSKSFFPSKERASFEGGSTERGSKVSDSIRGMTAVSDRSNGLSKAADSLSKAVASAHRLLNGSPLPTLPPPQILECQ
mmetsp:Transcript_23385/g.54377  ORF Transcript_23385/g.54377 Transcript_23385/m.54377 type:complete len:391 (+) Transcript_23385:142-1314(+)